MIVEHDMHFIRELCALYPVPRRRWPDRAAALSGDEPQILALARALMPRPRLLLLDEPSAGLSPRMLLEVFDAVQQERCHEGVTVPVVEQNAMEALCISDACPCARHGPGGFERISRLRWPP